MKINVISVFPEFFDVLNNGIIGKALLEKIINLNIINLKKFPLNNYGSIDDSPYGGGEGMIISALPLENAIQEVKERTHVIYLSPQGRKFDQSKSIELSKKKSITFVCGRYEGIDQRFIEEYVDEEISIGDYVISGGELAACVAIDSICRNLHGVVGNSESVEKDSFSNGLLKGYTYTRPEAFKGKSVPKVLISGNHKKIQDWKIANSLWVTKQKRPDLFKELHLSEKEMILLRDYESGKLD